MSIRFLLFVPALLAHAALAAPAALTPASPQPDPAALSPGLHVEYVYPPDVRTLHEARSWKAGKRRGPDLIGFDYPDTRKGEKALTSDQAERVIAHIEGYMKFDAPGVYALDFTTNDGLEVTIGGRVVGRFDGRQPCESVGFEEVYVPAPGWYEVKALWFQRLNTSCLLMEWRPPGVADFDWTPNERFSHAR